MPGQIHAIGGRQPRSFVEREPGDRAKSLTRNTASRAVESGRISARGVPDSLLSAAETFVSKRTLHRCLRDDEARYEILLRPLIAPTSAQRNF